MSSRYSKGKGAASSKSKKKSSGISVCLKLNWNNNERIHIAQPVDARNATLLTIIHLAAAAMTTADQGVLAVLQSLLSQADPTTMDASLVYMRTSIPRNQWGTTTLESMGIDNAGGSALLTLNVNLASQNASTNVPPSPQPASTDVAVADTASNATTMESTLADTDATMESKPLSNTATDATPPSFTATATAPANYTSNDSVSRVTNMEVDTSNQATPEPMDTTPAPIAPKLTLEECLETILSNNFDAASKECCLTLLKMLHNILGTTSTGPKGQKVRTINLQNAVLTQKVVSRKGALDLLLALGFEPKQEPGSTIGGSSSSPSHIILKPEHEKRSVVEKAASALRLVLVTELGMEGNDLPKVPLPPAPPVQLASSTHNSSNAGSGGFDIYKGHAFNVTAAAAGANANGVVPDGDRKEVSKIDSELKRLSAKAHKLQQKVDDLDRGLVALRPGQQLVTLPTNNGGVSNASAAGGGSSDGALLAGRMKRLDEERKKRETGGLTTKAMRKFNFLWHFTCYQLRGKVELISLALFFNCYASRLT
jgi:hypothetical protein